MRAYLNVCDVINCVKYINQHPKAVSICSSIYLAYCVAVDSLGIHTVHEKPVIEYYNSVMQNRCLGTIPFLSQFRSHCSFFSVLKFTSDTSHLARGSLNWQALNLAHCHKSEECLRIELLWGYDKGFEKMYSLMRRIFRLSYQVFLLSECNLSRLE